MVVSHSAWKSLNNVKQKHMDKLKRILGIVIGILCFVGPVAIFNIGKPADEYSPYLVLISTVVAGGIFGVLFHNWFTIKLKGYDKGDLVWGLYGIALWALYAAALIFG